MENDDINNNNDNSSSDLSFYHESDSDDDNISYEEEVRIDNNTINKNNNTSIMSISSISYNNQDLQQQYRHDPQQQQHGPTTRTPIHEIIDDTHHDVIVSDTTSNTTTITINNKNNNYSAIVENNSLHNNNIIIHNSNSQLFMEQKNNESYTKNHTDNIIHNNNDDREQQTTTIQHDNNNIAMDMPQSDDENVILMTRLNHLKQKRHNLHKKLHEIQQQSKINNHNSISHELQRTITSKLIQYNQISSQRQYMISKYVSLVKKLQYIQEEKKKLDNIHVLHDVFYIFHRGYYATINGLRLGMSAPVSSISSSSSSSSSASSTLLTSSNMTSTGGITGTTISNHNQNSNHNNIASVSNNDIPWHEINAGIGMIALLISTLQDKLHIRSRFKILPRGSTTKVCFNTTSNTTTTNNNGSNNIMNSIGSGLYNSQNTNHHHHHQQQQHGLFVPQGQLFDSNTTNNNSISHNQSNQEWDLHFQPTTFSFFGKRHWNTALNILGYCLYEVIEEVKERLERYNNQHVNISKNNNYSSRSEGGADIKTSTSEDNNDDRNGNMLSSSSLKWKEIGVENVTSTGEDKDIPIVIPYDVELSGDWKTDRSIGYVKINGLDIGFHGDGIAWTKALRYVALDLKWVIAFVSKYIDS